MEVQLTRHQSGKLGYTIVFNPDIEYEKMLKIRDKLDALVQSIIDKYIKQNKEKKKNKIKAIAIKLKQKNVNATHKKGIDWKH